MSSTQVVQRLNDRINQPGPMNTAEGSEDDDESQIRHRPSLPRRRAFRNGRKCKPAFGVDEV